MNFNDLMNNLVKDFSKLRKIKIAFLGDTSTQMLVRSLKGYGYEKGYHFDIWEADYNQIVGQVSNMDSELYKQNPEYVVIFYSSQKLYENYCRLGISDRSAFASKKIDNLKEISNSIGSLLKAKIVVFNFVEMNDAVFGNYANKINHSFIFQLRKLNYELMNLSQANKGIYIMDLSALNNLYGTSFCFDSRLYVNADMVFSLDFLPILAKHLTDIVQSISGNIKKSLILDLDNTLWGGIIGDDGIENIQIGDLGIGKAYTDLQRWIKALRQRGVILAVCSKNSSEIAMEPFIKHPDMILRMDDFAVFVANWESKVDNIKYIQRVLNIGFDSMVFLDDNPVERHFVRTRIPEITVPELPEDPTDYLYYLRRCNLFETASFTEEDEQRTQKYREEAQREAARGQYGSEEDYLSDLGMAATVKAFDDFTIPRAAQLTQRTNQFNLRTIRYSEEDIRAIANSHEYLTLAFTLEDRFGNYGLVSIVILNKHSNYQWIDTWIMSCRVFNRRLEHFVMNEIVRNAKQNECKRIVGEFIPTAKNSVVEGLYQRLGFSKLSNEENQFYLIIDDYTEKKTYIKNKGSGE